MLTHTHTHRHTHRQTHTETACTQREATDQPTHVQSVWGDILHDGCGYTERKKSCLGIGLNPSSAIGTEHIINLIGFKQQDSNPPPCSYFNSNFLARTLKQQLKALWSKCCLQRRRWNIACCSSRNALYLTRSLKKGKKTLPLVYLHFVIFSSNPPPPPPTHCTSSTSLPLVFPVLSSVNVPPWWESCFRFRGKFGFCNRSR